MFGQEGTECGMYHKYLEETDFVHIQLLSSIGFLLYPYDSTGGYGCTECFSANILQRTFFHRPSPSLSSLL